MPKVIANKLTGETIPDIAANRIKTFREEFKGNYRAYNKQYETIIFGENYDNSHADLIAHYGLTKEHDAHIAERKNARMRIGVN